MTGHDLDARATRRASLSIGWQIMVASAVLVLGIVAVAVVFILHQSLPREQIDRDAAGGGARVYVDTGDVFQALVLIGIGAVVFAGLVSWFIARRAVRPLGHALKLQREFVADASHELRTPLAVLDARIQVLERRLVSDAPPTLGEAGLTVAELRSDSRALIDIVNDLLLAAGGDDVRPDPVTAGPVIVAAVDSLRILATERDVELAVDVDSAIQVRIPVAGLRRCVVALVDNALSHAPVGSVVDVTATHVGDRLRLEVRDQGGGIQGIAPERVFDRFAHSTAPSPDAGGDELADGLGDRPGRTVGPDGPDGPDGPNGPDRPHRPSFGIGLALVREIATRQGGTVRVGHTSSAGTTMTLELPVVR